MPLTSVLIIRKDKNKKREAGFALLLKVYKRGEINGISASSNERLQRAELLELVITVN